MRGVGNLYKVTNTDGSVVYVVPIGPPASKKVNNPDPGQGLMDKYRAVQAEFPGSKEDVMLQDDINWYIENGQYKAVNDMGVFDVPTIEPVQTPTAVQTAPNVTVVNPPNATPVGQPGLTVGTAIGIGFGVAVIGALFYAIGKNMGRKG